jgi:hypothetical protein
LLPQRSERMATRPPPSKIPMRIARLMMRSSA